MQKIVVSPPDLEARFDDIMTAAIDRGLDACARQEVGDLKERIAELEAIVDRNARCFVDAYAELFKRVAELEATAVRAPTYDLPELEDAA